MRRVFYQWAGVGILSLIGWGVSMMPNNTSWIPSVTLWAIAGLWFVGTLVYWWKNRGKKPAETGKEAVIKSENLIETLTEMHRRLVELQKEKALHTKVRSEQWEKAYPMLMDQLDIVKLEDQPKFRKDIKRRIQKRVPRRSFKQRFSFKEFVKYREIVRTAGLQVALEVQKELCQSKGKWTIKDGVKVGEWLDARNWGVKALRDNDLQWKTLFKSISHYFVDAKLRELIDKHIDASYVYNSSCLVTHYSRESAKDSYARMLHEVLVGSPISPEKMEIGLSEILEEITRRIKPAQPPENWIDAYKAKTGKLPLVPAYLRPVCEFHPVDQPVSKDMELKTPSGQLWDSWTPTQQEDWRQLVKWCGKNPEDYLANMRRMLPKKSPKGPGRWTPFKQG